MNFDRVQADYDRQEPRTPAIQFSLAILNEDDTVAASIDVDDENYKQHLAEFAKLCDEYVEEGFDGMAMALEPDPARYGAS